MSSNSGTSPPANPYRSTDLEAQPLTAQIDEPLTRPIRFKAFVTSAQFAKKNYLFRIHLVQNASLAYRLASTVLVMTYVILIFVTVAVSKPIALGMLFLMLVLFVQNRLIQRDIDRRFQGEWQEGEITWDSIAMSAPHAHSVFEWEGFREASLKEDFVALWLQTPSLLVLHRAYFDAEDWVAFVSLVKRKLPIKSARWIGRPFLAFFVIWIVVTLVIVFMLRWFFAPGLQKP